MEVCACNLSTYELRQEDHELEVHLGSTMSSLKQTEENVYVYLTYTVELGYGLCEYPVTGS